MSGVFHVKHAVFSSYTLWMEFGPKANPL